VRVRVAPVAILNALLRSEEFDVPDNGLHIVLVIDVDPDVTRRKRAVRNTVAVAIATTTWAEIRIIRPAPGAPMEAARLD